MSGGRTLRGPTGVILGATASTAAAAVAYWSVAIVSSWPTRMTLAENLQATAACWAMMIVLELLTAVPVCLVAGCRRALVESLISAASFGIVAALIFGGFFALLMSGMVEGSFSHSLLLASVLWTITGATAGGIFHLAATAPRQNAG